MKYFSAIQSYKLPVYSTQYLTAGTFFFFPELLYWLKEGRRKSLYNCTLNCRPLRGIFEAMKMASTLALFSCLPLGWSLEWVLLFKLLHLLFSQESLTESCTGGRRGSCLFTRPSTTSEGRAWPAPLSSRLPSVVSDPGVNVLWGQQCLFNVHWELNKCFLNEWKNIYSGYCICDTL